MNEQTKLWLDQEMKEFSQFLKQFRAKINKWVPVWMAISVAGMFLLGILVGYDITYVLRMHFLIGCGIAFLYGSPSTKDQKEEKLYTENQTQSNAITELIRKYSLQIPSVLHA